MNFDRVQTKKNKMIVTVTELHPGRSVLTLNAYREGGRFSTTLSCHAISTLGVTETNNRLIAFENYDTSVEGDGSKLELVVGIVDQPFIKLDKKYKSYDVHSGTRTTKSKEIYTTICSNLGITDNTRDYHFDLEPIGPHAEGTYRLVLIQDEVETSSEEEREVEVTFDKGENVEVIQA